MIYTLTLNPAIDYFMDFKGKKISNWEKTNKTDLLPGGKGVNASKILLNLGLNNEAIIFSSGLTGKIFNNLLDKEKIKYKNFDTHSEIRINVKAQFDETYELGATTSNFNKDIQNELIEYLNLKLKKDDTLMIMGSTMEGLPKDILSTISKLAYEKKVKLIYDLSNDILLDLLKYEPFLLKPNVHELGKIFNVKINSYDDLLFYSKKLLNLGAKNVIISDAEKGAYFFNDDIHIKTDPIEIDFVNSSGAGDSMIAGFVYKFNKTNNYQDAINFANACGAATASSKFIATKEKINDLYKKSKTKILWRKND